MQRRKKKNMKFGFEDYVKANRIASRNEQFERNGGGQFVSTHKVFKNKKKYDRKRDKQVDFAYPFLLYI